MTPLLQSSFLLIVDLGGGKVVLDLDLFWVDKGEDPALIRDTKELPQGPGTSGSAIEGRWRVVKMQISSRQLEQAEEHMQQDNWRENEEKRDSGR